MLKKFKEFATRLIFVVGAVVCLFTIALGTWLGWYFGGWVGACIGGTLGFSTFACIAIVMTEINKQLIRFPYINMSPAFGATKERKS